MAARLTDRQKKMIIETYIQLGSYHAAGKAAGVSPNTVKKLVQENEDIAQKCEQKKERNTADILAHMETQKGKVCQIIDLYLNELLKVKQFDRLTPNQLTTAMGTLIDKWAPREKSSDGDLLRLIEGLKSDDE